MIFNIPVGCLLMEQFNAQRKHAKLRASAGHFFCPNLSECGVTHVLAGHTRDSAGHMRDSQSCIRETDAGQTRDRVVQFLGDRCGTEISGLSHWLADPGPQFRAPYCLSGH